VNYYDRHAASLSERYLALAPEVVHGSWAGTVLGQGRTGFACDIGAGSGRDANWLALQGWEVVAVEPSSAMRALAARGSDAKVTWLDDRLPELRRLRALGHRFDLVLVSAVWMHLPPAVRERAFRILAELLRPGGSLVITLRHGEDAAENRERGFHAVSADELLACARRRALVSTLHVRNRDARREDLHWETLVFTSPASGQAARSAASPDPPSAAAPGRRR
jgi:SAM-dependent methyltransferase